MKRFCLLIVVSFLALMLVAYAQQMAVVAEPAAAPMGTVPADVGATVLVAVEATA